MYVNITFAACSDKEKNPFCYQNYYHLIHITSTNVKLQDIYSLTHTYCPNVLVQEQNSSLIKNTNRCW